MKILLTTHENADPDAIASVLVLKEIFKDAEVYLPKGPSKLSRNILNELNISLDYLKELDKNFDLAMVLDTSNEDFLRSLKEHCSKILVIDHHKVENPMEDIDYLIFETPSLSEAIYLLFGGKISNKLLELLAYGILTDTSFLTRANQLTKAVVNQILSKTNKDLGYFISKLKKEPEQDVKIALSKALKRIKVFKKNNIFIALTHVSSYESLVASRILKMYFDLVLVLAFKKKERLLRIVLRSRGQTKAFDLARAIAKRLPGSNYGGHENAAIVNIRLEDQDLNKRKIIDKYLRLMIDVIKNDLGNDSRKLKEITD